MSRQQTVRRLLADHHRVRTTAFALLLLLSQAGLVIAGNNSATAGP